MRVKNSELFLGMALSLSVISCASLQGKSAKQSMRETIPMLETALKEKRYRDADSLVKNGVRWTELKRETRIQVKAELELGTRFLAKIGECEVREIKQGGVESLNECYLEALSLFASVQAVSSQSPSAFSEGFGRYMKSKVQTAQRKKNRFTAYKQKIGTSVGGGDLSPNQLDKWVKSGFVADEVSSWVRNDFSLNEALDWKGNGFEADSATIWRASGLNYVSLRPWQTAGFAASEVAGWMKCFSAPDSASVWKAKGELAASACQALEMQAQPTEENSNLVSVPKPANPDKRDFDSEEAVPQ